MRTYDMRRVDITRYELIIWLSIEPQRYVYAWWVHNKKTNKIHIEFLYEGHTMHWAVPEMTRFYLQSPVHEVMKEGKQRIANAIATFCIMADAANRGGYA